MATRAQSNESPGRVWTGQARTAFLIGGVAVTATGLYAAAGLSAAPVAAARMMAIAMLASGAVQIVQTFGVRTIGSRALWLLGPVFYLLATLVVFDDSTLGTQFMTLLLVMSLAASGLARGIVAIDWLDTGWKYLAASGAVSVLAAAIIATSWPSGGAWLLGLLLTADLVCQGLAFGLFGLGLRSSDLGQR